MQREQTRPTPLRHRVIFGILVFLLLLLAGLSSARAGGAAPSPGASAELALQ